MRKVPEGLVQKRQGHGTELLRKAIMFFAPLRLIQLLGFLLIFSLFLAFSQSLFLQSLDQPFFDQFLRYQPALKVHPSIVYIGIDKNSLQTIKPFPWPKRYYAAMTRILRQWGAKAIVYNLYFTLGSDTPEDNRALIEEFRKTDNLYLPVSFESEGFRNYYYVNQSEPVFAEKARGIGHINYNQDPDGIVRRVFPYVKLNGQLVPHLGIRVAYEALGRSVPLPQQCDFPRDHQNNLLIHWAKRWNDSVAYYSFSDVLSAYALNAEGKATLIKPEYFKNKICLIGLMASDYKMTPLEGLAPGIGILGNIVNMVLTGQYIREVPLGVSGLILGLIALLSAFLFISFRGIFTVLGGLVLACFWIMCAFVIFSVGNFWTGVAVPLLLILCFFLLSFVIAKITDYKEKLFLLDLAVRDPLTGLYAKNYISTFLPKALKYSRTFNKPFSVILFELDDFKKICEVYGSKTGETVLKKVSEILLEAIRTKGRAMPDIAGRYGEDTFIALLLGHNLADTTFGIAERIRKTVELLVFQCGQDTFTVRVSAGVSVLRADEKNPNDVIERAHAALLKAKFLGKNQTCIHSI